MTNDDLVIKAYFLLDTPSASNPSLKIKDETDYITQGIPLADVKGILTVRYGATVIYSNLLYASPDVNPSVSLFSPELDVLPLDSNGKVINATYEFIYSIQVASVTIYTKTFSYSYCDSGMKGAICATSSCFTSQLTAKDESVYVQEGIESSTRSLKIQYPRNSLGTPVSAPVTTTNESVTIGPNIWTGNYTISLSTTIVYIKNGLSIQETITAYIDHAVRCYTNMCSILACVSSLNAKYFDAQQKGSARVSELQMQCFTVSLLLGEYNLALLCKDENKLTRISTALADFLELNTGCNCGCDDCGDGQNSGEPAIINPIL